jgi:uncharacterized HAD superfamily protein
VRSFKVGFDIDDVLFPWYARAHEACEEAGITNGVEPTTWRPYEEYGCSKEDWLEALDVVTLKGNLYLKHGPDEDALRALRSLYFDGHEVHLITARGFIGHSRLISQHTVRWLEQHAVPYKTLSFTRAKGARAVQLGLDFFIDDNIDNFMDVYEHGVSQSYLLDRPWNRNDVRGSVARVKTVQKYVDIIKEAAEDDH